MLINLKGTLRQGHAKYLTAGTDKENNSTSETLTTPMVVTMAYILKINSIGT